MPASRASSSRLLPALLAAALVPAAAGCSSRSQAGEPDDGAADLAPDEAADSSPDLPEAPDDMPYESFDPGPDLEDTADDVPADDEPDAHLPEMHFYFGNFHSHTGFSEGVGTPAENFSWARDIVGLDFYAVTDHAEQVSSGEWTDTATQADGCNATGVFAALRGFEWSNPLIGHSCTFDTTGYTSSLSSILLGSYYSWVDSNDGLSQFNHPGREVSNFNNLALEVSVVDNFFAIEVGNKGDGIAGGEYYPFYVQALDLGWIVAPTANQDNHDMSVNCHRSVYVGLELSREALLEAMVARRIYASDDPNMEITFKHGDSWMGSSVWVPGGTATFTIHVVDDEPITLVELVSNGGTVVSSLTPPPDSTDVAWDPTAAVSSGDWFFVKVTESDILDGEPPVQMAVTAPFWII